MKKKLFYLLVIGIVFNSCKKEDDVAAPNNTNNTTTPVANFNFTGANAPAPRLISFSNTSSNSSSYNWDFGDGSNSSLKNPTHLYADGGNYSVTLTANGEDSKQDVIAKTISIEEKPSRMKITGLWVLKMPMTNSNGAGWDTFDGPDVYFTLTKDGQTYISSNYYSNITSASLPLVYTADFPFTITYISSKHTITLYDYEVVGVIDDLIGGWHFWPNSFMPTNGTDDYPSTIELGTSSSAIHIRLYVEWL